MKRYVLPIALCAGVLGGGAYYHMHYPPDREQYVNSLEDPTPVEMASMTPKQLKSYNAFFNRTVSRATGALCKVPIPVSLRKPVYSYVSSKLGINTDEMKGSFEDYRTPAEFFSRPLNDNARPICDLPNAIVSPVDGCVVSVYRNDPLAKNIQVNQVKGLRYSLKDFFGLLPPETIIRAENSDIKDPRYLYSVVIYLSPSNYHRVHTPTDFTIKERQHYPGYVLPVKESFMTRIKNLLAINERVCLKGDWTHGFFSLSLIGAYNVGSITLPFEPDFKTNRFGQNPKQKICYEQHYDQPIQLKRGEECGKFNLGSTVVLIFESPEFEFVVKPGEKVKLGQPIGRVVSEKSRLDDKDKSLYSYLGYSKENEQDVTDYFQGKITKSELDDRLYSIQRKKLEEERKEELDQLHYATELAYELQRKLEQQELLEQKEQPVIQPVKPVEVVEEHPAEVAPVPKQWYVLPHNRISNWW